MPTGVLPLIVEFAGERFEVSPGAEFVIGRDGDLIVDDNPYLHRQFLVLSVFHNLWWISNVGSRIAAMITDGTGRVHARIGPEARLPLVFDRVHVLFSAGATNYDFTIHSHGLFEIWPWQRAELAGEDTIGDVPLSQSQRLLVVALSENVLRYADSGSGEIPSTADCAARLGWTVTAFTRKLDAVCTKLDSHGVTGLRGGRGRLATNRRMRLVEHAVATRLVTREDLALLDQVDAAGGSDLD